MTVKEVLVEYMRANGYDALICRESDFCACPVDDLNLCGCTMMDCEFGHEQVPHCNTCVSEICEERYEDVKKCYAIGTKPAAKGEGKP